MYWVAKDSNEVMCLNYLTILLNALKRSSEARICGKMHQRTPVGSGSVGLKCLGKSPKEPLTH